MRVSPTSQEHRSLNAAGDEKTEVEDDTGGDKMEIDTEDAEIFEALKRYRDAIIRGESQDTIETLAETELPDFPELSSHKYIKKLVLTLDPEDLSSVKCTADLLKRVDKAQLKDTFYKSLQAVQGKAKEMKASYRSLLEAQLKDGSSSRDQSVTTHMDHYEDELDQTSDMQRLIKEAETYKKHLPDILHEFPIGHVLAEEICSVASSASELWDRLELSKGEQSELIAHEKKREFLNSIPVGLARPSAHITTEEEHSYALLQKRRLLLKILKDPDSE
ncbi:hypothetical protein BD324DRAFT_652874 [Kockovaella imperatae]|uniref:Uncharacterized protein n=1 Tax=Kockovaella imperatae TaxID=4999 RepID=A0A1Y1UAY0_9TREE|nr:hypothetical protein BD324DRAFT_652874 [Kockovaella imperatae]ORX35162.1 hypothetical protein BD324DRAFT_652874 [Kockovaella imperatae]